MTPKTRQSEKRTNKARQRLARETGISGGAPVSISDTHRAEMRPCFKAAKPVYHACREEDRERIQLARAFRYEILQKQIDGKYKTLSKSQFVLVPCSACSALLFGSWVAWLPRPVGSEELPPCHSLRTSVN
jgi:hypothetical protein